MGDSDRILPMSMRSIICAGLGVQQQEGEDCIRVRDHNLFSRTIQGLTYM